MANPQNCTELIGSVICHDDRTYLIKQTPWIKMSLIIVCVIVLLLRVEHHINFNLYGSNVQLLSSLWLLIYLLFLNIYSYCVFIYVYLSNIISFLHFCLKITCALYVCPCAALSMYLPLFLSRFCTPPSIVSFPLSLPHSVFQCISRN